jgi:hypothetical protein
MEEENKENISSDCHDGDHCHGSDMAKAHDRGMAEFRKYTAAERESLAQKYADFISNWNGDSPNSIDEVFDRIKQMPPHLQSMAIDYPPGCLVEAKESNYFFVPAPGHVAVVIGYDNLGLLFVKYSHLDPSPIAKSMIQFMTMCDPKSMIPVAYCPGITPKVIQGLFQKNSVTH